MKKLILFLFVTISILSSVIACSFAAVSFCRTNNANPDQLVVSGKIIQMDDDGIDLQILKVLKGVESRETIRIWDGTDFDCNGPFSMAAFNLGELNDSIIVILPLIDTMQNTWDVIGDFRVPTLYGATSFLRIQNDTVRGYINGTIWASVYLNQIVYTDFIDQWEASMSDCITWVDTNEIKDQESVLWYTNPVQSICTIHFKGERVTEKILDIYSYDGKKMKTIISELDAIDIDLSSFSNGLYFIKIRDKEGAQSVIKVVKS